jgi:hypothetical protein
MRDQRSRLKKKKKKKRNFSIYLTYKMVSSVTKLFGKGCQSLFHARRSYIQVSAVFGTLTFTHATGRRCKMFLDLNARIVWLCIISLV